MLTTRGPVDSRPLPPPHCPHTCVQVFSAPPPLSPRLGIDKARTKASSRLVGPAANQGERNQCISPNAAAPPPRAATWRHCQASLGGSIHRSWSRSLAPPVLPRTWHLVTRAQNNSSKNVSKRKKRWWSFPCHASIHELGRPITIKYAVKSFYAPQLPLVAGRVVIMVQKMRRKRYRNP